MKWDRALRIQPLQCGTQPNISQGTQKGPVAAAGHFCYMEMDLICGRRTCSGTVMGRRPPRSMLQLYCIFPKVRI